ncbi:putative Zn-dependent hydrolase/oxidoreductase family protein [Aspergillus novofumigatus IBT 16806]|uniref:Metallo-beta-lactamase domain-containing protein n=1 Tax=Aspergillus novofumigatus (strain IBT 16806) TaxID=1392255 RepID=A0A2I1BTC6_ASPN1|nr:uncharacterized protein P174DRAFT_69836 [Aspergillus novofumigatus IBT 16806]PKX88551.1 hypothetical protein P174DRAFT_69836 [Aspergillus novofumigatus IBT 16806]
MSSFRLQSQTLRLKKQRAISRRSLRISKRVSAAYHASIPVPEDSLIERKHCGRHGMSNLEVARFTSLGMSRVPIHLSIFSRLTLDIMLRDTGYRAVPELPDGVDDHGPEYNYPSCPAFKQVGEFRGPFDLGLIPIGAYAPRFIMSPMHADPHDAVEIFRDTKCKRATAMHWGTWVLTEEDVLEPAKKLKEALKKHSIPEEGVFDVCDIGESREY